MQCALDHPETEWACSQKALADTSGMARGSVQRALRPEASEPSVALVQKLAESYQLMAWQLLVPGLDPSTPPELLQTQTERRLQEKLRRVSRELEWHLDALPDNRGAVGADDTQPHPSAASVATRFRALRKAANLSQAEMARRIGIRQGSLSLIETGDVVSLNADTLVAAAAALNVDAEWHLTGRGSQSRRSVTEEERKVLTIFRDLTPEHQKSIMAAGGALLAAHTSAQEKPGLRDNVSKPTKAPNAKR